MAVVLPVYLIPFAANAGKNISLIGTTRMRMRRTSMLLVNKLTRPGGIRRLDLYPDRIKVILSDGTEKVYVVVPTEDRYKTDNIMRRSIDIMS